MASAAAAIFVATASAFALSVVSAATAASTVMSVASAATSACVDILTMKSLCEFLLCGLSDCEHFSLEMESLACHLVVEVHLDAVFSNLDHYSWDNSAHAVHHRNGVARYEKILADLAVDFECRLRKVNNS